MYDILCGLVEEGYDMNKIQWNDDLSIKLEAIDTQHKKWIEHYNEVVEAIESRKDKIHIIKTLGFLSDYTNTHFCQGCRVKTEYSLFRKSD